MGAAETWLTPDEVGELTGLAPTSYRAQCKRLAKMGVPFKPNGIGRPLVERYAVLTKPASKKPAAKGPNWSALDGTPA